MTLSKRVLLQAQKIAAALNGVNPEAYPVQDGLTALPWDEGMQIKAANARWNGGTESDQHPRIGMSETEWFGDGAHLSAWAFERYRFISLSQLAAGYRHTGNEDYAQAARDYIEDFLRLRPEPPHRHNTLNLSIKTMQPHNQGWLGTLPYFLGSAAYDEAFVERVVEACRAQVAYLVTDLSKHGNTRMFAANCILWAGLAAPWLEEAEEWRVLGSRMYNDSFHREFNPDGTNLERDSHYLGGVLTRYGQSLDWAKAFPELRLSITAEKIVKSYAYWAHGHKPIGSECCLHDSRGPWTAEQVDGKGSPALASRKAFLKHHGLPDEELPTSAFFPHAGQVFLRDHWGVDATYLTFDATTSLSAHSHLSRNSIQFHHHGRTVLMDPGMLTYSIGHMKGTDQDEAVGVHGKGTRAHNTVNLNGWNQFNAPPVFTHHWHCSRYDLVQSKYAGGYWPGRFGWWFFEGLGHGMAAEHERILLWVQDRFALVIDQVCCWNEQTLGDTAHTSPSLEMNWQFCPGKVTVGEDRAHSNHEDANVLILFPRLVDGMTLSLHEGEMDPPRGWINTPERGHRYIPAPQLACVKEGWTDYVTTLVSVIVPYCGTAVPEVEVTFEGGPGVAHRASAPNALTLTWGDGTTDRVVWTESLVTMLGEVEGCVTDASMLHLRRTSGGEVSQGAFFKGTHCAPFKPEAEMESGACLFVLK